MLSELNAIITHITYWI